MSLLRFPNRPATLLARLIFLATWRASDSPYHLHILTRSINLPRLDIDTLNDYRSIVSIVQNRKLESIDTNRNWYETMIQQEVVELHTSNPKIHLSYRLEILDVK